MTPFLAVMAAYALSVATPRMTEARAVKRARDIAQEMGLQKLPTDFESLSKFPAVLAALAAELVEAAA